MNLLLISRVPLTLYPALKQWILEGRSEDLLDFVFGNCAASTVAALCCALRSAIESIKMDVDNITNHVAEHRDLIAQREYGIILLYSSS